MTNNPHQTKRGVVIANFAFAFIVILFTLIIILTGCVPAKKYNALMIDYQNSEKQLREITQQRNVLIADTINANKKGGKNE